MTDRSDVLSVAATYAAAYVKSAATRPIATPATLAELRARLDRPLPEKPSDATRVIDDLVRDASDGILTSTSPRFFGWVIGGTLPVALAADWLTSAWDQNAASNLTAPAEAVVEEICGRWIKEMLGLPATASFAFVTGCQMAHATAFAAARHKLLRERHWDVEAKGLSGAPPLRIVTTANRHESIIRAVRLLGIGSDAIVCADHDATGRLDCASLERVLQQAPNAPTIIGLQAGDLNTGVFDPYVDAVAVARRFGAWVHVDGAFGLWVAASNRYRHLLGGAENADSWATDGHKWLNLPFDSGLVFVADAAAHSAAFSQDTSYSVPATEVRNQKDWNPEWSRRGRGFAAYAAIRALGRAGIADIVDRCCDNARRLVDGIGTLTGAEILARPVVNQGLVRFLASDGNHDRRTDEVIAAIQAKGVAWFGGVSWGGQRAMRISVCNWATTELDVELTIESIREVLAERPA